ncbi:MAG: hypothetical protein NUW37_13180 [Planctomycetes bacterium]|nr:hypothetical protein [Planctomycetota bacterium]
MIGRIHLASLFVFCAISAAGCGPSGIQLDSSNVGVLDVADEKLKDGEYVDYYFYEGKTGEIVVLDVVRTDGSKLDPYVILFTPNAYAETEAGGLVTPIAEDDDSGADGNARLIARLAEDGMYQIGVTSKAAGETGGYEFKIRTPEQYGFKTAKIGESYEGSVEKDDYKIGEDRWDIYLLTLKKGEKVTVTMEPSAAPEGQEQLDAFLQIDSVELGVDVADSEEIGGAETLTIHAEESDALVQIKAGHAGTIENHGPYKLTIAKAE